jgi:CubicO group peptidase (beta-lactamase class C family)
MAEAISRRDGRPFDRFCREEIFEPLQMTRTSWGLPESLEDEASDLEGLGDAADLCGRWNSRAVRAAVIPGGGLFTCARDLGRFYAALGRELLTPATLRHVTTQQGEPGGSGWGYGFTVGVEAARVDSRGNLGSPRQFGHSGFCVAQAWRDPETDTVAVFILNRGLGQAEGDRILNLLSDAVHRAVSR